MLGSFESALKGIIKKIEGTSHFDDDLLDSILKDLSKTLIASDVEPVLAFSFIEHVKKRVREEKGLKFTVKEQFIYVIYDELTKIVGKEKALKISEKPFKILLVGLFGSGKTTTSAKMAKYYKKRGYKVALLGLDTFRAAAREQLRQLGDKIQVPVFIDESLKNPDDVIKKFEKDFEKFDIVIADSAGRDALHKNLAKEIKDVKKNLSPQESILVLPADIGQSAKAQAKTFKELVNVKNVIITRMDGTAKGGGVLTACFEADSPIVFIGTGEKVDDFEEFDNKGFISRLLGLGDLNALLKKAKDAFTEEDAKKASEKFFSKDFNLIDFYDQLRGIKKMGSLSSVVNLIPGVSGKVSSELLKNQEGKLEKFEPILSSMTYEELTNPKIISGTRVQRIAFGAGVAEADVRDLLDSFRQLSRLSGKINPRKLKMLEKNFDLSKFKGLM
ncbi:MAG: signal recognition particle receptor subunit alpha [Candidatus Nanoarchaeia archaeon]|nr:signal recognition particle receptor subunit alpha [Candidatus Nanoarchaeia archaeon]